MRIRFEGTEKEVVKAMELLQLKGIVCGVSRVYHNRDSDSLVRMYAQETKEGQIIDSVVHKGM